MSDLKNLVIEIPLPDGYDASAFEQTLWFVLKVDSEARTAKFMLTGSTYSLVNLQQEVAQLRRKVGDNED